MLETMDVIRHMAHGDLRLVWYHGMRSGRTKADLVELQTTSARELNTASMGFAGPAPVSREVLNELLQLKFVDKVAASDATKSVFHLSDAGRARALVTRQ